MTAPTHNIRLNSTLRDFLQARHIQPKDDGPAVWRNLERLVFSDDLHLSDWTRHVLRDGKALILGSLGYMSYAYSPAHRFRAGAFCSIAAGVTVMGDRHPHERVSTHPFTYGPFYREAAKALGAGRMTMSVPYNGQQPLIAVGNDVWIGARVTLTGGISIGTGAILGTGAIVTRDVPPYGIVVGAPGRVVKHRFPPETIARLLESHWWDYPLDVLAQFDFLDPDRFCDAFAARQEEFQPRTTAPITAAHLLTLA